MTKATPQMHNNEVLGLAKFGGLLVTLLAVLAGIITWADNRYVSQRLFDIYQVQATADLIRTEEDVVRLIEALERERQRDFNVLSLGLRNASLVGIVIRRDILLARGRNNLTQDELAELDIIEVKMKEIKGQGVLGPQ